MTLKNIKIGQIIMAVLLAFIVIVVAVALIIQLNRTDNDDIEAEILEEVNIIINEQNKLIADYKKLLSEFVAQRDKDFNLLRDARDKFAIESFKNGYFLGRKDAISLQYNKFDERVNEFRERYIDRVKK